MKIKTKHIPYSTNATTTNPKDIQAAKKVDLSAVPPIAIAHEACALMEGNDKYGPFNWRAHPVSARIYVAAALRHLYAWFEGEEVAADSGVHHLGHARACLAILLDAQETGNLVDDRPITETLSYQKLMDRLNEWATNRNTDHRLVPGSTDGPNSSKSIMDTLTEYINEASQNYKDTKDIT